MNNLIIYTIKDKTAFYASVATILIALVIVAIHPVFGEPIYWDNWLYTLPILILQFPIFAIAQHKLRNVNKESSRKTRALKEAILNWTLTFGVAMFAKEIMCMQTPNYLIMFLLFPLVFIVGYGIALITKE